MMPSPIKLLDRPLVAVHRFHHVLDHRIKQLARLLRIAVSEQLHRAFHVGEQHRDLLALAFERALGSENLFGEMLGSVSFGRSKLARQRSLELATLRTRRRIYFLEDSQLRKKGTTTPAARRTRRRTLHRQDCHAGSADSSSRRLSLANIWPGVLEPRSNVAILVLPRQRRLQVKKAWMARCEKTI